MSSPAELSLAQQLAAQPQHIADEFFGSLSEDAKKVLVWDWSFWARPKQLWPVWEWQYWLILAGRGFGKTRTLSEWVRYKAHSMPGSRGAIVAPTAADARDVLVEGNSGIIAVSPPHFKPRYETSKRRLTWPNGSIATLYSAEEPDRLRGPQHHWAGCDELAAWKYGQEAWDMLMFGMRLGRNPQVIITTTPRPITLLKELVVDKYCHVTSGTTYENKANLADAFFSHVIKKYEGTRLGRQELEAEILTDVPGALWRMGERGQKGTLENSRVRECPELVRIVVAVDPPGSTAECGIAVVGLAADGTGYVLADASTEGTPAEWSEAVVRAFGEWQADAIVAEANQGGQMVENTIRTSPGGANLPVKLVWASRSKQARAEPISALYEQERVKHVGAFPQLESQMTTWVPGDDSPDRMDALVWGMTELFFGTDNEELETLTKEVKISRW